jgi:hypothetical protein
VGYWSYSSTILRPALGGVHNNNNNNNNNNDNNNNNNNNITFRDMTIKVRRTKTCR